MTPYARIDTPLDIEDPINLGGHLAFHPALAPVLTHPNPAQPIVSHPGSGNHTPIPPKKAPIHMPVIGKPVTPVPIVHPPSTRPPASSTPATPPAQNTGGAGLTGNGPLVDALTQLLNGGGLASPLDAAAAGGASTAAVSSLAPQANSTSSASNPALMLAIVAAIGVVGFLAYKHTHKKGAPVGK